MIERVISYQDETNVDTMTKMAYSLPQAAIYRTDAIAPMPGLGETWRVTHAVDAWESHEAQARYLLVAGSNAAEKNHPPYTLESIQREPINLRKTEGVVIQGHAYNAPAQADWLRQQVEELDIRHVSLVVSPYHLLRGFCTVVANFKKHGTDVPVFPVPAFVPPDVHVPELDEAAWDLVAGENERILNYQKKGDVLGFGDFKSYIGWLWSHETVVRPARTAR